MDAVPPPEVVTFTVAIPAPPGEVAVMEVPDAFTLTAVAEALPKETVDPCVNPAPVIVTTVPPLPGPELGVTPLMTGV